MSFYTFDNKAVGSFDLLSIRLPTPSYPRRWPPWTPRLRTLLLLAAAKNTRKDTNISRYEHSSKN